MRRTTSADFLQATRELDIQPRKVSILKNLI